MADLRGPDTEAGRSLLRTLTAVLGDFAPLNVRAGILAIEHEASLIASPFAAAVAVELASARVQHAPVNSLHEGYSVILEELDEFWEEVRSKSPDRRALADRELVQIAAMAQRTAEDVLRG